MLTRAAELKNSCVWFHATAPLGSSFSALPQSYELINSAINETTNLQKKRAYQDTLACLYWNYGEHQRAIQLVKDLSLTRDFTLFKVNDRCRKKLK